jgi:hypothetical protein
VSEKSIRRQQAALVRGARAGRLNPATSVAPTWLGNSVCPSQEQTIRETEVQIRNSECGIYTTEIRLSLLSC